TVPCHGRGGHSLWEAFFTKLGFHHRTIFVRGGRFRTPSNTNHDSSRARHTAASSCARYRIVVRALVSHARGRRNGDVAVGRRVLLQACGNHLRTRRLRRSLGITKPPPKDIDGKGQRVFLSLGT